MKISEVMTKDVLTAKPSQTIQEAASMMARIDSGAIMVEEQERLIGMITDRDIAIRAVAEGLTGTTPISKIMSGGIRYCYEDEDIEHVARNMADVHLRRLPVLNRDKRLVGVVSLGNIASTRSQSAAATVLCGVAQAH
ncbi:CBS domain-containing protein [Pseudomonas frederiksbergensis]|jgi:CBS domain-containing protein|uniref:CBS domain-containing protein n=1 Tax=Pseudomonas frederiksbergensis TaxID=104087 RepID=A0AB33EE88_9PSED|nr:MULTISPECIES: CBS domain-containing protein [Pseudomonas]ATE78430.1 CBS domain-containing protein [Pseudomonas frederiksbergensis]MBD9606922.1 CBS domain-containing protein [Pseudomonas sp. PDM08]MBD9617186.1 CBS domain-containing protein [Pseudomonas sp. PDM07]MDR7107092.1 CBS domain-containing protein [Pseudomonas frederiksbergensis]PMY49372.1 CBS domain-containing protein [Pseudomonas sp. FW305-53]